MSIAILPQRLPNGPIRAGRDVRGRLDEPSAPPDAKSLSPLLYVSVWYQGPHDWFPQYYMQRHTGAGQATAAEIRQGCMGMFSALELASELGWSGRKSGLS